jgi:hypothetical protein
VVIFKTIAAPSMKEFQRLLTEARRKTREIELKRSDTPPRSGKVRGRK